MNTTPTSAQRAAISLIVDTAIDVSLEGTHKAVADYRGDVHAVFVSTCRVPEWFYTGEPLTAFLARYADEDEAAHRERVNNELAALYDHLKALLPESQS